MISFVRGPGGPLRRLLAEGVPCCVGVAAAGCALPFLGLAGAVAVGLATWIAVSAVLRPIRRHTVLRRAYRFALLAHVVFWSVQGVLATVPGSPGPLSWSAHAWGPPGAFRAGYGSAAYDLPPHATLAGWGARPRRAAFPPFAGLGVLGRIGQRYMEAPGEDGAPRHPLFHGPTAGTPGERLGARAIVLRPETAEGAPVAIVRLDLVTSDALLAAAIRGGLADLGFRPETFLVAATHTHSGPGGYSRQAFSAVAGTDHYDDAVFRAICNAAVAAVRNAHTSAVPARITLLRSRDRGPDGAALLARNRLREGADAIDDRVYGLRLTAVAGDRPIAVVLNYAVHPTLLRRRHMGFHRDLAGALEDALEARLPGRPPVLFLNGATADTSSVPGVGPGAERAKDLAGRFVERVAADFQAGNTGAAELRVRAARVSQTHEDPRLVIASSDRAAFLDAHAGPLWSGTPDVLAAKALALPANVLVWSLGFPEIQVGFHWNGSVGAVVNLTSFVRRRELEVGALAFNTAEGGRWVLLWVPGEATQALGRTWRAHARTAGFDDALLVGFANGSAAYLTTPDEYREHTYEARATLFGPEAGARVGAALQRALDAVTR